MLTYILDNSEIPMYEQLYQFLKKDIYDGTLRAHEKLPSKRTFAKNLGVSTITVQNAYDQLIAEGYLYTVVKKGYYVSDIAKFSAADRGDSGEKEKSERKKREEFREKSPEREAKTWIDLSSNRVDPDNFPFSIWTRLMRETISMDKKELMERSPGTGVWILRKAIADHLYSYRKMEVDPNQIIVGAGTEYLYGLLIQLLGKEKRVCLEDPGYPKAFSVYRSYGVPCLSASMDEKGIRVEELERLGAQIVHISPTHHFPTGITMPVSRRYELLLWAGEETDRYIIEDDYDSEFRQNGRPVPSLQSIDEGEQVIYMNTFSKSLTPTIRIAYMVLPRPLMRRYQEKLNFYACTVSNFEQYTLSKFIERGYFEKHINRMRLFYLRQRSEILEILKQSRLFPLCEVHENASGLHFLMEFHTEKTDQKIQECLEKKGIHMAALSEYYKAADCLHQHQFLLNYSNLPPERMQEIFDEVAAVL